MGFKSIEIDGDGAILLDDMDIINDLQTRVAGNLHEGYGEAFAIASVKEYAAREYRQFPKSAVNQAVRDAVKEYRAQTEGYE